MQKQLLISLIVSSIATISCVPLQKASPEETKCGYESCHAVDPKKLNVHLVPHSHDDVGWLKTLDQYYYGNNIKMHPGVRGVRYILDSVVQALQENPDRRFIQVETAFFSQWWEHQANETKEIVKDLVNSGQLEMVGGAWSMNDEAATNYQAIIDQFTLGLRTLNETFGECGRPKVGWQIDPFGHSNEMATIFAELGFDGLFFTRLDYRDSEKRNRNKDTEFIWTGSKNLGSKSDIFTSLIYRFYDAPPHFCWDVQCGDTPIIEDEESIEYNLKARVTNFAKYVKDQAKSYKTNNILVTMGGDFTYQAASMYYMNIDKLIKGFKKFNPEINVIYSTPSCYLKAVNEKIKSDKIPLSTKTDDFMPLASDPHSYWTGYYTSRPNSKRFEREGNNLLQITKQLVAFERAKGKDFEEDLSGLKKIMGVMQHHDAITGTEKQHVANDYVRSLNLGIEEAEKNVQEIVGDLLSRKSDKTTSIPIRSCLLSNVTRCEQSHSERFVIAIYNPISRDISEYVRIPVTSIKYLIKGLDGAVVPHQVAPAIDTFDDVGKESSSMYELVFRANDLPPLGLKYYFIQKMDDTDNVADLIEPTPNKYKFGTDEANFELDQTTGFLMKVTLNGKTLPVAQKFFFYTSAKGANAVASDRASGAYIFRPSPEAPNAIPISNNAQITAYAGELFDEVHQKYNDWVKQIIRIYKNDSYIEFDWVVGPIEYADDLGVEVITRFDTDLKTEKKFYTDSNGRGLIERQRDFRQTFTFTNKEPISGNYYPVTSRIVLKDKAQKIDFAVLNDRSQGGSSLADGKLELMVHRRLKQDDNFGVGEVLNEQEFGKGVVVRGHHYLVLGTDKGEQSSADLQQDVMQRKQHAPWIFVGKAFENHTFDSVADSIKFEFSGLAEALPKNVQILTLETWAKNSLLLRLEHLFEKDEDATLSEPVTVNLKTLFTLYKVTSIKETTLGANQWKLESRRLKWLNDEGTKSETREEEEITEVTLNPMEIRTFILEVEPVESTTGGNEAPKFNIYLILVSFIFIVEKFM